MATEILQSSGTESKPDRTDLDTEIMQAVNHRRLNPRQIQLFAIAGSIGKCLLVTVFCPGLSAFLIAFIFWASVIWSIAQCQTEIITLFPVDGAPLRLAGRMVDPALGVAAGWNYFFIMTSYVVFEATVINTVVEYWGYDKSPAILISVSLFFFFAINVYRADLFGEVEFWIALGKVMLVIGLMFYTLVTMLGGNPLHDRFGFRYWKDPGVWAGANGTTRLQSFVNAVNVAGYCMGGPEYISMIAGESKDPRRTIPRAFNTIVTRLVVFFIGGALCVGILVPYNDETLTGGSAKTYTGASPTKFLRRLNKKGVPYMAVIVVILLSCLAYLALGSSSAQVLNWILNFGTAGAMFNWCIMAITWIRFDAAIKAQGIDRKALLHSQSRFQPFAGYWAFFWAFLFLWLQGYAVFLKGNWKVSTFIFNYGIIAFAAAVGLGWKIIKRTPFHRSEDVDLVSGLQFFDALTEHYRQEREGAPVTVKDKLLAKLF
ncbi:hypothetical protein CEP52_016650 [Fusarium oligoseptatum]|uniref:Amino acid permease/ SLC12A domain-containing protein n=1 Tax=Fusarium oligoseptatum TaxID=2604345 RepID=A0A428S1G1_9HYPO|nr:hypothetical protein CEP52_016650 [Fusarium oligoseptatum]